MCLFIQYRADGDYNDFYTLLGRYEGRRIVAWDSYSYEAI